MQRLGLILVASYPKSGNTWFRAVLRSALSRGVEININEIGFYNAADRFLCDRVLGIPTADLSPRDIANLRPGIYASALQYLRSDLVLKVHDAWLPPFEGGVIPFSPASIKHVIYIVRDPRAVAASAARYMGLTVEQTIARMNDRQQLLAVTETSLDTQVTQLVSSWSRHVASWIDAKDIPVQVIKYEDMIDAPLDTFGPAIHRIVPNLSNEELEKSVLAAQFDKLSNQEAERGFGEKYPWSRNFFSSGRKDGWREQLTLLQADTIVAHHESVMRRLGYTEADNLASSATTMRDIDARGAG